MFTFPEANSLHLKMDHLKMYFLLVHGDIPASYVSLPEGKLF